jgi:hypothetical protein
MTDHRDFHIGPHTRDLQPDHGTHPGRDDRDGRNAQGAHDAHEFDREISLKGITWTTVALVAMVVVSAALMWWLLRGFARYDDRHDVRPSPIAATNPQQPPPAPRLQVAPGFEVVNPQEGGKPTARSDREDMQHERDAEDKALLQPRWIDQGQGTVRVPIEAAMRVIAARGVGPEVVGGRPGAGVAAAPSVPEMRMQTEITGVPGPQRNPRPGATLQNTFPPAARPAPPPPAQRPPEERRQP